jgi:hypothetical protein
LVCHDRNKKDQSMRRLFASILPLVAGVEADMGSQPARGIASGDAIAGASRTRGESMRDRTARALTWAAIIGLGVADGAGWPPAKIIAGVIFLLWLIFCAIPWVIWYFRGGARTGGDA